MFLLFLLHVSTVKQTLYSSLYEQLLVELTRNYCVLPVASSSSAVALLALTLSSTSLSKLEWGQLLLFFVVVPIAVVLLPQPAISPGVGIIPAECPTAGAGAISIVNR